jgi:hypothetical protein
MGFLFSSMLGIALLVWTSVAQSNETLYRTAGGYGCLVCHGKYANGGGFVGGNIRGATVDRINKALATQPTMLLLAPVLDDQQRAELSDYLQYLADFNLVEWNLVDGETTQIKRVVGNKDIQLVIKNETFTEVSIDLAPLGKQELMIVQPLDTEAVVFSIKNRPITLESGTNTLKLQKMNN